MNVSTGRYERSNLFVRIGNNSILGFGMFTIALIGLIVAVLKNDKKK